MEMVIIQPIIYLYSVRNVFLMISDHLYTLAKTNMRVVTLAVLTSLIIFLGVLLYI
jgi:hypothetical protein